LYSSPSPVAERRVQAPVPVWVQEPDVLRVPVVQVLEPDVLRVPVVQVLEPDVLRVPVVQVLERGAPLE
jgi:hypothetical protein